jgi:hypothetical protein
VNGGARHDRSGRPASHGSTGSQRSGASQGGARTGGRQGLQVGSLVGGSTGRGQGSRRARG